MANWWSWLTGGGGGNGGTRSDDFADRGPEVIPSDFERPTTTHDTSPRATSNNPPALGFAASGSVPRMGSSVLVDDPLKGAHEIAEIKPMGVIAPRNKHELIEELRKNYTDVIELVRKTNTHLDDQSRRQASQDQRHEQMIQLTREVAGSLAAIQVQNARLVEAITQLSAGQQQATDLQGEIREALLARQRQAGESTERLHGTLESIRELADHSHATQRDSLAALAAVQGATEETRDGQAAIDQMLRRMGTTVASVHTSAEQLVAITRAGHEQAEKRSRATVSWRWMGIAGLALAGLCVIGLIAIAILLRG